MGLPQTIQRFTPREYYDRERAAVEKSDYYDGKIYATPGRSIRHSLICTNVLIYLGIQLMDKPCRPYESNLRLRNKSNGLRNYPDISVYCDPLERDEEDPSGETVTNPTVLFEVLSPSTEAYDRGFKSESYRRIDSLKAYVLISQDDPHIEIYERQPTGFWLFREEHGLTSTLSIPAIAVQLPLANVYRGAEF